MATSDNITKGLALALELSGTAMTLLNKAQEVGALVHTAQSEGRDLTDAEMDTLRNADDLAKKKLELAIAQAGQ